MATLELTDQQVIELVMQLPDEQRANLLRLLVAGQWERWKELTQLGAERIQAVAAERGRNWGEMTEEEREAFVDDLVHEDRACSQ